MSTSSLPREIPLIPQSPRPITPCEARALVFVKAEIAAGRPFPMPNKVAMHMGWARRSGGGLDVLLKLRHKGFVEVIGRNKRGHRIWGLADEPPGIGPQ